MTTISRKRLTNFVSKADSFPTESKITGVYNWNFLPSDRHVHSFGDSF